MVRKIIYSLLLLLVLFTAFVIVGVLAPEKYQGEITQTFPDRQIDIWRNLVSLETITVRKPEVEKVTVISDDAISGTSWKEDLRNGDSRTFRVVESDSPDRFVFERIISSDGVTGTWEFDLVKKGKETEITVSENSVNENVLLRAYYTIIGRNVLLRKEIKSLRVSLFQRLITTP